MKRLSLLIGIIILSVHAAWAQKENNVWAFGDGMGISFNGSTPSLISTAIHTTGGSAGVCNANGQLLFYTQGDTVWNAGGQVIPNGAGLIAPYGSNAAGNQSSQGQLIMPVIGNASQYYVFSVEAVTDYIYNGDPYAGRLYYSVVDMSLNGGLGGVVAGKKKIPLDSAITSEKMIAIPGSNCSMWLLVHKVDDNTFRAFKVNDTGVVATPVSSACGNMTSPLSYALGKMKVSPDGQKLVTSDLLFGSYGCELYDFNKTTGVVSNPVVLDSIPQGISACFSPGNLKLYYFSFAGGNGALYQYDLSLSSTAAIISSKVLIDSLGAAGVSVYDAKRGPDGKVYVKMPYSSTGGPVHDTIGRIDNPDLAGAACGYTRAALVSAQAITLGNGDLPNDFIKPLQDTTFITGSSNLTVSGTLVLQAPAGYTTYEWSTGDTTGSITVSAQGTYWVISSSYCSRRTDTFNVEPRLSVQNTTMQAGSVHVYPNPASDNITVTITGNTPAGILQVTDMLGKVVTEIPVHQHECIIPVAGIAAGIYTLVYAADDRPGMRSYIRFVISR